MEDKIPILNVIKSKPTCLSDELTVNLEAPQ